MQCPVPAAELAGAVVLAPLVPVGIGQTRELSNYKFIGYDGIRVDHITLAMIDEVAEHQRIARDFLLHGFSGGGLFTHRMLNLHPNGLWRPTSAHPASSRCRIRTCRCLEDWVALRRSSGSGRIVTGCVLSRCR
jgi:hypothetical protein